MSVQLKLRGDSAGNLDAALAAQFPPVTVPPTDPVVMFQPKELVVDTENGVLNLFNGSRLLPLGDPKLLYDGPGPFVLTNDRVPARVRADTSAGPVSVELPAVAVDALEIRVADVKGAAATNPITITAPTGTINGASSIVLATGWGQLIILSYVPTAGAAPAWVAR